MSAQRQAAVSTLGRYFRRGSRRVLNERAILMGHMSDVTDFAVLIKHIPGQRKKLSFISDLFINYVSGMNTKCIVSKIFHIPQIFFSGYIVQVAHVERSDRLVFGYLQFWHFTGSVHHFLGDRIVNTIIPDILRY